MEREEKKIKTELNVEEFLFNLRRNVITNEDGTQFDRVLYRSTADETDYRLILMRAWCVWKMEDMNITKEEKGRMFGSKAKDAKRSSYLLQATALYKLIVVHKMWKLRFLCPTKPQLKTLLTSGNAFKAYFAYHTDEFWQTKDDIPEDINEWIKQ
jgi:hypothetical protein